MNGQVIPNGSETFAWFEWGETPLGRATIKQRFTEEKYCYQYLTGLKENTIYYNKLVVENAYGRIDSEVGAFRTPRCGS